MGIGCLGGAGGGGSPGGPGGGGSPGGGLGGGGAGGKLLSLWTGGRLVLRVGPVFSRQKTMIVQSGKWSRSSLKFIMLAGATRTPHPCC